MRSDSFHRQNVQRIAGLSFYSDLYARYIPSRLSDFGCRDSVIQDQNLHTFTGFHNNVLIAVTATACNFGEQESVVPNF
jgi:hypothetical protein